MRKATIGTRASVKINTGNYETVEVCKQLEVEVDFENPDELRKKSSSLDKLVAGLLHAEADAILEATGRAGKAKVPTPAGAPSGI